MGDYPDYTTLMQIIGTDIMVAIDLQGAYIMMPVDIQAQYITLDIDIVAQTVGNLSVNIAAASIGNITVDIVAQTVGDITINIAAQNIGLWGKAGWEALQGHDKSLLISVGAANWGEDDEIDYTVPSGKTLYIVSFSGSTFAVGNTDADKPQMFRAYIRNVTTSTWLVQIGGNGGFAMSFPTPLVISENEMVRVFVENRANHQTGLNAVAMGFEV